MQKKKKWGAHNSGYYELNFQYFGKQLGNFALQVNFASN